MNSHPVTTHALVQERYDLRVLQEILTMKAMKALVTSKGQVTIPKELREKFGIQPGAQVDFAAAEDDIRLRKVVDRSKRLGNSRLPKKGAGGAKRVGITG